MNDNVLDLDALVPAAAEIKFGDQLIAVQPPRTADIFKLGALSSRLQEFSTLSDDEAEKTINGLTELIGRMIPELDGKELNTKQILVLVKLISDMAMPPDAKELEAMGISPAADPKKVI